MGNKKVLSKATRELNKTKRVAAPKNIIEDPRGQWAHPGEITRIPSDTITMQGVPYPVMAYPNMGEPQMMYPGQEYYFPGAEYVDEYPQMKKGGTPKSLVKMPKPSKKGLASKKFSRSLDATNKLFTEHPLFAKPKSKKRKVFDPNAVYQDGGIMDQEEPTGGITSQEEIDAANRAMMKARLAYAHMHGNPAAQRMVVAPDQPYVYTGEEYDRDWNMPVGVPAGETGTHYMASFGNYAVPFIQQGPNGLQFNESPSIRDREAIRFDSEADAEYFGGHYKEVAPDKSYRRKIENGSPYITSLSPEDEEQFQRFYNTLPENLQSDDPSYDIRGYWDSEGRPEEFDYSQPKEDDGYYHAYSINQNTGEYLKNPWHPTFQHAIDEDKKIGYRPVVNVKGELIATENPSIADPEEQTFLRNTEGPANYIETELTPEEIEEYRRGGYIIEDLETYPRGGGLGKGKRKKEPKKVEPFVTSDPAEYAYRKAAYKDSLDLYNQSMGLNPYSSFAKPISKQKYDEINKWEDKQPQYFIDKVSLKKDLKNKKVKDFSNYVYNLKDPKNKKIYDANISSLYKGDPSKYSKTLKDGRIKTPEFLYKGKPNWDNYHIYDPKTGTTRYYHYGNEGSIENDRWNPSRIDYYGEPKPNYSDVISTKFLSQEYKNKKLTGSKSKNQEFVSPHWGAYKYNRYSKPVQEVIFRPEPQVQQYPTEYKPEISQIPPGISKSDIEKRKVVIGDKVITGYEEEQQLDPKTGKVTTVINPVYEDLEKPIPTLHPTRVNPELQKFVYPETELEETEDIVEEDVTPEEQVYVDEEGNYVDEEGNYVDMGRKGILPDLYIDTHKHKFSTPKYRVRKPGHGGDLIKRVGTNYHYLPGIEKGLSSDSYMDYKQDGGIVQLDGYRFKKDDSGNWFYESGAPVTDRALVQRLTYESKPIGSPVVQNAPRPRVNQAVWENAAGTSQKNAIAREKQLQALKASPVLADKEKAAQIEQQRAASEAEYMNQLKQSSQYEQPLDMMDWLWGAAAIGPTIAPAAWAAAETAGTAAMPYINAAFNTVPGQLVSSGLAADAIVNRLYPSVGKIQEGRYGEAAGDIATGVLDLAGANMLSPMYKGAKATVSELAKFIDTGVPRELPGSPNSLLESGRAYKTIYPDQEHKFYNESYEDLYKQLQQQIEEQKKISDDLANFDPEKKINQSKVDNESFRNLIMGDDLKFKFDDYPDAPRIPYTKSDRRAEGVRFNPRVQYKPMDPLTRAYMLHNYRYGLNNMYRTERLLPSVQTLRNLPKWTIPLDAKTFSIEMRNKIINPRTGKPITLENIERASPKQLELWKQQGIKKMQRELMDDIELQSLMPKYDPRDFNINQNKEGGMVLELTDKEIKKYMDGGWIIEEM